MLEFLYSNIEYPRTAREEGAEGKVIVSFVVGTDGELLEPKILRSADERFNAEVLRILAKMPAWTPGRQAGKVVQVSFVLPLMFKLS